MNHTVNNTSFAERLVDSPSEMVSFRDMVSKVFLRPKLFLFALLVPAIIATSMSAMVPVEWSAATKVLIRYSAADAGFLKSIVSEGGLGLSGATSAELIKSAPVLERTIDAVGIQADDIYQKPSSVITSKLSGFFRSEPENTSPVDAIKQRTALVGSFKASLDSSSKKAGSSSGVEILEKTSLVPESMKLDELITVEVKSFNREKVDDMANGLASAFIDEYYNIYQKQATQQTEYINTLIEKEEQTLRNVEKATAADLADIMADSNSNGIELSTKSVPILASLATELTVAEAALTKAQQVYASSSPQVSRLRSQVANFKFMLKKQERIEISKQLIEQLKAKRFQAENTLNVYKSRLVPINIVERAEEPNASGGGKMKRVITSALIGLVLGALLAIGLMVILNVLDPRIHFKQEVEKWIASPVIGQLPYVKGLQKASLLEIRNHEKISQSQWQMMSKMGEKSPNGVAKVVTVTGVMSGDGGTFTAKSMALNLAKNRNVRVCLIDANLRNANLSKCMKVQNKPGLIEAIAMEGYQEGMHLEEIHLQMIGAGNLQHKTELGHYVSAAATLIDTLKTRFDFIVIDAGSLLNDNEARVFGRMADELLLVVSSGVTRKSALNAAARQSQAEGLRVSGVIFNRSKEVLPAFIYNLL